MCVIIYKPADIELKESIIEKCWENNPHGAGLAYFGNNGVIVEKGFMELADLKEKIKLYTDTDLVIHFRLATHGQINKAMTHPFAVSRNYKKALALNPSQEYYSVLFHNGIIAGYGDKTKSDTVDFVVNTLSGCRDIDTRTRVLELTDCKYVLMQEFQMEMVGEFKESDGCLFSNLYWKVDTNIIKSYKTNTQGTESYTSNWQERFLSSDFLENGPAFDDDNTFNNDLDSITASNIEDMIDRQITELDEQELEKLVNDIDPDEFGGV